MENVASLAVLLAFCVAIYALVASVVGRLKRKPFLIVSGERAVYSVWVLITIGSARPGLRPGHRRFPLLLRRPAQQPRHAAAL